MEELLARIEALEARTGALEQQLETSNGNVTQSQARQDGPSSSLQTKAWSHGNATHEKDAKLVIDVDSYKPQSQANEDGAAEPVELDRPSEVTGGTQKLQASAWDAALLIGHKHVGVGGSLALLLILLANIGIQGLFCTLGMHHFTSSRYGDAFTENMHWWRTEAHQKRYEQEGLSLAERVCNQDPTLMLGTDLKQRMGMIKAYHPDFVENPLLSGPVMVLLALACWYATLSKEGGGIVDFGLCMVCVPKGRRTVLLKGPDGGVELRALGRGRTVLAALIILMRLGAAWVLLYVGTLRTAYTTNWGGILLNAVKLAFIINVDELLFAAAAPSNVKVLLGKLKPLRKPRTRSRMGLDAWSCAILALIPLMLLGTYFMVIVPELQHQLDAYNEICGGDRTFLLQDQYGIIIWTEGAEYAPRNSAQSIAYQSTHEIIDLEGRDSDARLIGYELPSDARFQTVSVQSSDEMSQTMNPHCLDLLDHTPGEFDPPQHRIHHANYFRVSTGNHSISSCGDVAQYCSFGRATGDEAAAPNLYARRFCPRTCGCHHPSALLENTACPQFCAYEHRSALEGRTCQDIDAQELRNSAAWRSVARQQAEMLEGGNEAARDALSVARLASIAPPQLEGVLRAAQNLSFVEAHPFLMLQLGCDYFHLTRQYLGGEMQDLCIYQPNVYFCPEACLCRERYRQHCPPRCAPAPGGR